jgi:hypothetical protein
LDTDFESKTTFQGLTFKLYRAEGSALLAFDLAPDLATRDFVGFSIEVRYPGADHWGALHNRLHFDYPPTPERPRSFASTEAPFQKFRWIHVPSQILPGVYRYRVTACYMGADGALRKGVAVENQICLEAQTISGFLNVGFTRGSPRPKPTVIGSTMRPASCRRQGPPPGRIWIWIWRPSKPITNGWVSRRDD